MPGECCGGSVSRETLLVIGFPSTAAVSAMCALCFRTSHSPSNLLPSFVALLHLRMWTGRRALLGSVPDAAVKRALHYSEPSRFAGGLAFSL